MRQVKNYGRAKAAPSTLQQVEETKVEATNEATETKTEKKKKSEKA
ncbi:hypothetical protein [Flammeovirga kamogawensis]|uniref:Uncharacterized protein n=1 Tax=Flammeovirga kamogawensis TaxID=373891 RepID=A0ABX8H4D6_9BACT|nr:hypothetical protein [Flammeovirga kamogawensis]MBB6463504.1 hypothetical protein [Flammeovirga kamogawensis]QWG10563.1 hypothetical protein KM029_24580 [Flammeovirga kamogawensis]